MFPEEIERLHKRAEEIVRREGTSSEKFGLRYGLYPLWAVEKARRLLKEQGQEGAAELGSSESSANQKLFVTALAKMRLLSPSLSATGWSTGAKLSVSSRESPAVE